MSHVRNISNEELIRKARAAFQRVCPLPPESEKLAPSSLVSLQREMKDAISTADAAVDDDGNITLAQRPVDPTRSWPRPSRVAKYVHFEPAVLRPTYTVNGLVRFKVISPVNLASSVEPASFPPVRAEDLTRLYLNSRYADEGPQALSALKGLERRLGAKLRRSDVSFYKTSDGRFILVPSGHQATVCVPPPGRGGRWNFAACAFNGRQLTEMSKRQEEAHWSPDAMAARLSKDEAERAANIATGPHLHYLNTRREFVAAAAGRTVNVGASEAELDLVFAGLDVGFDVEELTGRCGKLKDWQAAGGMRLDELAALLATPVVAVDVIDEVEPARLTASTMPKVATAERKARIIELWSNGVHTVVNVAKAVPCSPSTVSRVLAAAGLRERLPSTRVGAQERLEAGYAAVLGGSSATRAATEHLVSRARLRANLKSRGYVRTGSGKSSRWVPAIIHAAGFKPYPGMESEYMVLHENGVGVEVVAIDDVHHRLGLTSSAQCAA